LLIGAVVLPLVWNGGATAAKEPAQSNRVTLGDPELTAGIPGEGKLTVEQIKKWLADPANHQVLEVELPEGLKAGQSQIYGLEQNPLTRAKIELGRQLYFDPRLSANESVSCASCHRPSEGYARHTRFGIGIGGLAGDRNSPVAFNRLLSKEQFWDGRAESLEEQAKGPIANPVEMGNTHEACVACLLGVEGYRLQFERIFPKEGLTIDTVAKAIASFERAIVTGPAPADYYEYARSVERRFDKEERGFLKEDLPEVYAKYQEALAGSKGMSESAKRGREIFFSDKGNCTACHVGANFTDEKYHNIGVGMEVPNPDLGRYNVTQKEADKGAFKTPTVRNVAMTAPYMHDGSQKTLEEVVEWYVKGGHPNPYLSDKMKKLDLSEQDKKDLVNYMKSLTGPLPKVERGRLPE
jgi:cytochrome c peroxidase